MGFIKDLSEAINKFVELEKLSIFCFTLIILTVIINGSSFFNFVIFYCIGIIIFSFYVGLHRITKKTMTQNLTNPNKPFVNTYEGFDFQTVLSKKHPYNLIKKSSIFFFIIGTIYLLIDTYFNYLK